MTEYDPGQRMTSELLELARGLPDSEWRTEHYLRFEQSIDRFLEDDDEEALIQFLNEMAGVVDQVLESYGQAQVLPKEVTVESTVTHQMLVSGAELWNQALEEAYRALELEEADWDQILAPAEEGNRRLVAVQVYSERLENLDYSNKLGPGPHGVRRSQRH